MEINMTTQHCGIHQAHRITVFVNVTDDQKEYVVGALDGFLNSFGCTVCSAEGRGFDIDNYVELFVERFLPEFIPVMNDIIEGKRKETLMRIKPISYG